MTLNFETIHKVCSDHDLSSLKELLREPGVVNWRSEFGGTILHSAAQQNFHAGIELLLWAGADPSIVDENGYTPMMSALDKFHPLDVAEMKKTVQMLIDAGANLNPTGVGEKLVPGWTPLLLAVKSFPEIIPDLIRAGACIEAQLQMGWTPFLLAASELKIKVVKQLLEAGANSRKCLANGKTAITLIQEEREQFEKYPRAGLSLQLFDEMIDFLKSHGLGTTNTSRHCCAVKISESSIVNSIGMVFHLLDWEDRSGKNIYISQHPVTFGDWKKVMELLPAGCQGSEEEFFRHSDTDLCDSFIISLAQREQETGFKYRLPNIKEWLWADLREKEHFVPALFEEAFKKVEGWGIRIALDFDIELAWNFALNSGGGKPLRFLNQVLNQAGENHPHYPEDRLWEMVTGKTSVMHDCMWEDGFGLFGIGGDKYTPKEILSEGIPIFAYMVGEKYPAMGFRLVIEK